MRSRKFNPFEKVSLEAVPGSLFDLSHDIKTSFNPGKLIPLPAIEVYPGDNFQIKLENMFRFAPLITAPMHRMRVKTQFFFVPNRLLWDDWEDWITGKSDLQAPYMRFSTADLEDGFAIGSKADYLGYPTMLPSAGQDDMIGVDMSPLPIYAYQRVWFDWYRHEHLSQFTEYPDDWKAIPGNQFNEGTGGNDVRSSMLIGVPYSANWEMDYFTACLPEPQNGDPVLIPIFADDATDVGLAVALNGGNPWQVRRADNLAPIAAGNLSAAGGELTTGGIDTILSPGDTLKVDVSQLALQAGTIQDLTLARVTQNFLERQMRGGNTYKDYIYAHFQTRNSDDRLQRAEYLGGITQNMLISEVLSTAETEAAPQANIAGHGISAIQADTINFSATEHGWIIGIMYAVPDTAYYQGLHRSLFKLDPLDYMIPGFANIGEQPVYKKELYVQSGSAENINDEEFGYLPVYSDLRYLPSRVTGDMRDSLDYWHWARTLNYPPTLNESFVQAFNVPLRTFAVTDSNTHHIWAHIFLEIQAYRKLPKYGIPRH